MSQLYGTLPALTPGNMARINCPIFGLEVELRGCFRLKELWMRGQAPSDKRRGCQACMKSSMCPAYHMTRMMEARNDFYSAEQETITIPRRVLERIGPIAVLPGAFEQYNVPPNERARIDAWVNRDRSKPIEQTKRSAKAAAPEITKPIGAPSAGSYADAINSALEKAA